MKIFKEIFLHDTNGSLFAMIPYVRNMEEGEVSIYATGASNDNLDDAILQALKSEYPNIQTYKSEELNDEQIKGNLRVFGSVDTEVFTIVLSSKQVFQIPLTVWIGKNIHFQDREKIKSKYIRHKTEKEITPKQVGSLEALNPGIIEG